MTKVKTKYNTHLHISFQSSSTSHHTIITIHTHHHISPTVTIPNISQEYKTSKSRPKITKTIIRTQRKTPYQKIPCVVPHQLLTNNSRSSTSIHCRFPASHCQHYYHHISQENAPHIIPIKCHENNAKARNATERQRL